MIYRNLMGPHRKLILISGHKLTVSKIRNFKCFSCKFSYLKHIPSKFLLVLIKCYLNYRWLPRDMGVCTHKNFASIRQLLTKLLELNQILISKSLDASFLFPFYRFLDTYPLFNRLRMTFIQALRLVTNRLI